MEEFDFNSPQAKLLISVATPLVAEGMAPQAAIATASEIITRRYLVLASEVYNQSRRGMAYKDSFAPVLYDAFMAGTHKCPAIIDGGVNDSD